MVVVRCPMQHRAEQSRGSHRWRELLDNRRARWAMGIGFGFGRIRHGAAPMHVRKPVACSMSVWSQCVRSPRGRVCTYYDGRSLVIIITCICTPRDSTDENGRVREANGAFSAIASFIASSHQPHKHTFYASGIMFSCSAVGLGTFRSRLVRYHGLIIHNTANGQCAASRYEYSVDLSPYLKP
jgi:hypothetical protein